MQGHGDYYEEYLLRCGMWHRAVCWKNVYIADEPTVSYSEGGSSFPEAFVNSYQNSRCHTGVIAFSGKFYCNDISNTGVV
jgi:hypothetical protein